MPDITREQVLEAMAIKIRDDDKCGDEVNGYPVFCDNPCLIDIDRTPIPRAACVCKNSADSALTAIEALGLEINQTGTQAELELLEEVCAIYASDEDRYLKESGEAYGSIPTECGMKARTAARRFHDREAMLSSSPLYREENK